LIVVAFAVVACSHTNVNDW